MAEETKFENKDLPLILLACQKARDAKAKGTVTVNFDQHGGVLSVVRESKETLK